jgi:glycosyltransferase involved in cell wall biosynthesis
VPTVSVAILTYNRTKELRDCLYSLLSQSVKPFEIIVVDN